MTRATFRQTDLTRAIRAAKAAGMAVSRCEISPDGRIVLSETAEPAQEDAYGAWKAKRASATQGRS